MKKETLPEALLRLAILYHKIKHLDLETRRKIMADPSLLPQYVKESDI
ncbi:MAG: hypothetical protein KME29_31255 [Calothrix sp. FI2-JRJ7]|jgi:hypothetical protein|nr:hypothetical protein [Calothrix sp. FI2-JRJ7]